MGNITFLGVEGSGKTVLTMALVNLFKAHEAEGWFLRPETRSAFRFVEQVPPVLEPGSLPHQTTELRHLAMSVVKDGEVQRVFDILDYPGEIYRLAFLDAKDDPDPATFQARVAANREEIRALLGHLQGSDRVYVLFNLADAQDLAHNAQNLDAVWVTNACLDYLHRLPSRPEIALLLSQIDLYGNLNNPNLNPRRIAQQALPLITRNFPNLSIQAVSALGPASGPFGADKIVAECLKDTPAVRAYGDITASQSLLSFHKAACLLAKRQREDGRRMDLEMLMRVCCIAKNTLRLVEGGVLACTESWPFNSLTTELGCIHLLTNLKTDWETFSALFLCNMHDFQEGNPELLSRFHPLTQFGREWVGIIKSGRNARAGLCRLLVISSRGNVAILIV